MGLIRYFVETFALLGGLLYYGILSFLFYSAYLEPSKKILINVNQFGEADMEFFLVALVGIVMLIGAISIFKKLRIIG
jgi:hypothetical protein